MAALLTGLVTLAQAATPPAPAAAQGGGSGFMNFVPILLIIGVFYFVVLMPQRKKQKEHETWLKSLKKGDEVVTTGGLIGKITGLTDTTVTLEVQEKVRLKVLRSHVSGRPPAAGAPAAVPAETQPTK